MSFPVEPSSLTCSSLSQSDQTWRLQPSLVTKLFADMALRVRFLKATLGQPFSLKMHFTMYHSSIVQLPWWET